jgi:glucose/arabinose dehydrogenase
VATAAGGGQSLDATSLVDRSAPTTPRRPRPLLRFASLAIVALIATGCASGVTDPADDITDSGVTLHAHGSTGGDPTDYWFEYGTSTSYGSSTTHRSVPADPAQQNVAVRVKNLAPDTVYHFRACASNQRGSGCAKDATFRTGSTNMLPGFQETIAFSGLTEPTVVRFSPDGRVFVAEKSGLIKVFDGPGDTTPDTFADLRTEVHNYWDRGLLGMALDPDFPAKPFVYVLYTHDAPIGGTAPTWGQAGVTADGCPDPTGDGCVVSGRLSRLEANGNQVTGDEQVLLEDWCQQFPSHSIGTVDFGPDGALYVSGGDGASFNLVEYGQFGTPKNPCGDPPGGSGTALSPPTAEGGALRAQDLRTPQDPTGLNGALVRIDPDTGEGLPDNPNASNADPDTRRIVAYGLRNPFRFTFRPGTTEPWIGDVGWNDWEEIDRQPSVSAVENFGWPCFEGNGHQGGYDSADLSLCESLYASNFWRGPFYTYFHNDHLFSEENCAVGSSSISGMQFTPPGGTLPPEFDGALFFADYSRSCIWVMRRKKGTTGLPSTNNVRPFRENAIGPVNLQFGPGGDLYYPSFSGGRIRRIHYTAGNQAPRAVVNANRTSGNLPLSVSFDGGQSSDPDPGDTLSYAWDLDGDGEYDDATTATADYVYNQAGSYQVGLKVTDNHGVSATDTVAITAGNTPPTATIVAPTTGFTWKVRDPIAFEGSATDAQDGTLPPSAFSWSAILQHCPSNCHAHPLQSFANTDRGSFLAPDHEYPSYIDLKLTVTDSGGLTDSRTIRLDPKTVRLSFASSPTGLSLAVNAINSTTPFTRTVIQGSANSISGPTPQTLGANTYDFASWSDGGARTHDVTASANRSFTATYNRR